MTENQEFMRWYDARVTRRMGYAPAAETLRAKRARLSSCLAITGCPTVERLASLLTDRGAAETVLDRMHARYAPVYVQGLVRTLLDVADFGRAMGWQDYCALRQQDVPTKLPRRSIEVYSESEVELIVSAARGQGLRWYALMATLADTGRRISEVLSLEWNRLHLDDPVPFFDLPTTKNKQQQYVPLSRRLREDVFTAENIATLRIPERRFGRDTGQHPFPWSYGAVQDRFERYCRTVGVPHRGLHNLRHAMCTHLLARGAPIHAVQHLAGHSSVSTTERLYSHVTSLDFAEYLD